MVKSSSLKRDGNDGRLEKVKNHEIKSTKLLQMLWGNTDYWFQSPAFYNNL